VRTEAAELQSIKASNSAVSILQRKLREINRKLAEVLKQKDNLAGTCQSRAEYIDQLTAQAESLQAQKTWADEEIEKLKAGRRLGSEYQDRIDRLEGDLQKANAAVERLQEATRVQREELSRQKSLRETEIRDKENQYSQIFEQNSRLVTQIEEIQDVRNYLEREKQSLLAQVAEQRSASETARQKSQEQGEHIGSLQQELEERCREVQEIKPAIEQAQAFAEQQKQALCQSQQQLSELNGELSSLQATCQDVVREKQSLLAQVAEQKSASEAAQQKSREQSDYICGLEQEKQSLLAQVAEQRLASETAQQKSQEQGEHIGSLEREQQSLLAQVDDLRSRLECGTKELEEARDKCRQAVEGQKRLEDELGMEKAHLEQIYRQRDSLQGGLDQANGRIESLTIQLAQQGDSLDQAQEMIRQLQDADRSFPRPAAGLDASVAGAQEAINQFRKRFAFGSGHTRCGGQESAAGVEGQPESANGRTNEPADGKNKSLQYRLQILGGQGPGGA